MTDMLELLSAVVRGDRVPHESEEPLLHAAVKLKLYPGCDAVGVRRHLIFKGILCDVHEPGGLDMSHKDISRPKRPIFSCANVAGILDFGSKRGCHTVEMRRSLLQLFCGGSRDTQYGGRGCGSPAQ